MACEWLRVGLKKAREEKLKPVPMPPIIIEAPVLAPVTPPPLTPYEWAMRELGQSEIYGKVHNPRIVWYHSFTSGKFMDDETPWCASFVSAALECTGHKSLRNAWARSYINFGKPGDGSVGDIVVFPRHVGFVAKKYFKGDQYISVLGGNQADSVTIQDFFVTPDTVFRRPLV
jgi:uncharacterized protein (TIGR02594 family)